MRDPFRKTRQEGTETVTYDATIEVEMQHKIDAQSILIMCTLLVLTILLIWMFKRKSIRGLHETGLSLLIGMLCGFMIDRYERADPMYRSTNCNTKFNETIVQEDQLVSLESETVFDPELFFFVLLPPIIFFAGYDLKQKHFFRNITSILIYAFIGTTFACFATGGILFMFNSFIPADVPGTNSSHIRLKFADCLSFGAFISATDPVTVLAIYHDLHVDHRLFALVFGESVMNDAVALVLYSTIEKLKDTVVDAKSIFNAIGVFLVIFFGSFACGCLVGMISSLTMKFTKLGDFPMLETALFVLLSYMTFLLGEATGLSGIVAVLFCGITQRHYTYSNLSEKSKASTVEFFGLLNFLAENFIFSYIGMSFFTFPCHRWDAGFIGWSIAAIVIVRVVMIYPLSFIMNLVRPKRNRIPMAFQHCLVFAGLRGAIAFALAMGNTSTPEKQMILSTTLVIVLVTVLFFGGGSVTVLQMFKIRVGVKDDEPVSQRERSRIEKSKSWFAKIWQGFDKKYLKPVFTKTEDDWGTDSCSSIVATVLSCVNGQPEPRKPTSYVRYRSGGSSGGGSGGGGGVRAGSGGRGRDGSGGNVSDANSSSSDSSEMLDDWGEDEDDWGGGDIGGAKGDRVASNSLFPTFEPMEASKHNNSSLVPDASNA